MPFPVPRQKVSKESAGIVKGGGEMSPNSNDSARTMHLEPVSKKENNQKFKKAESQSQK